MHLTKCCAKSLGGGVDIDSSMLHLIKDADIGGFLMCDLSASEECWQSATHSNFVLAFAGSVSGFAKLTNPFIYFL